MDAVSKEPKNDMERVNKTLALQWSCRTKSKECLDDATKKLQEFLTKGTKYENSNKTLKAD